MTTLPDAIPVRLCLGLIGVLEQLELVEYRPDQAFPAGFTGAAAVLQSWPDSPDRLAALTPYPVADHPSEPMATIGVQIRVRWAGSNPRAAANFAGAIYDALHGLEPVTLPSGVNISQCHRRSGASMGQDRAGRWSWSDNYYVDTDYPSANR